MKITCWKATRVVGLTGLVAVCGCVAPKATTQTAGLTSQQLVNVADKPQSTSWLPKLPFTGQTKPGTKTNFNSLADDFPAKEPAAKGKVKEPADIMSLARLSERRGQFDAAKQMYHKELEKNPKNGRAHHRLAIIAAQEEQWDKANQHFAAAEKLDANNSELLCDMGYALYLQHRLEPAETYLRKAIEANPRNQAAHNNLGIVLGVQGKFEDSFAEFRRAGSAAEAQVNLAYVHAQLGDIDRAMASLNQALSIDPNMRVATVALLQLNEMKKHFAPDEETAVELATRDPIRDPAKADSSPNSVFQRQTAAAPKSAERPVDGPGTSERNNAAERPGLAKAAARPEPVANVARRATQASDLIKEVTDGPARTPTSGKSVGMPSSLAQLASTRPQVAKSETLPAESSIAKPDANRPGALFYPMTASEGSAAKLAAATDTAKSSPNHVVAVPMNNLPVAAGYTANKPASGRTASEAPAIVENQHLASAKQKLGDEALPAGKPPREVAARPLASMPGKTVASKPVLSASPANLTTMSEKGNVAHAAHPLAGDASRNVAAVGVITNESAQVVAASINLTAINKSKPSLAPPPSTEMAPIVSPSERMQQIRTKERNLANERSGPPPMAVHAISTGKQVPKDNSLLSMFSSADLGSTGMMPKVPQAPEDPANPASLLSSRQASVPIPRTEDQMPADAMLHQAPTSMLLPTAQSTWTSSSQPLRYLTDQAGMSSARAAAESASAAGAGTGQGRNVSPGSPGLPGLAPSQFSAPAVPKTY